MADRFKRKTLKYGDEPVRDSSPPQSDNPDRSGIRRRKTCLGPAWLGEEHDRFNACDPSFVCDDPTCAHHEWSDEDRAMLGELRSHKQLMLKAHTKGLDVYGPKGTAPNAAKASASLGAVLRANSRLYTFVVRKAVERSKRKPV